MGEVRRGGKKKGGRRERGGRGGDEEENETLNDYDDILPRVDISSTFRCYSSPLLIG